VVGVFSAGSVVLVYIIAGLVIPRESYGGGFGPGHGPAGPSYGWPPGAEPRQQPPYGSQGWPPGANAPGWPPASHPGPAPSAAPHKQGLDAMMEDIEKKALRREIEELRNKISKIEKDSKGE
jgi:phage shock protein C